MDEETCVVLTLDTPLLAERVRSRLPGLWNVTIEGTDVVVVAEDDAHAEEIDAALRAAVLAVSPAAEAPSDDGRQDASADIGGSVLDAGIRFLDYL